MTYSPHKPQGQTDNLPNGGDALQGAEEVAADEDEGLRVALASLRAGNGFAHQEVRKRVLRRIRP